MALFLLITYSLLSHFELLHILQVIANEMFSHSQQNKISLSKVSRNNATMSSSSILSRVSLPVIYRVTGKTDTR